MRHLVRYPLSCASLLLAMNVVHAVSPFEPTDQPIGYVAQPDLTNYDISSGTEKVFANTFEKLDWSGNLFAYSISAAGLPTLITTGNWAGGAAAQVDQQGWDQRKIITLKEANPGVPVSFEKGKLSANQQAFLKPAKLTNDDLVKYLRGDRSKEASTEADALLGAKFRPRASTLGDIIHSRPFYVKDATNPRVYVGANDGMLHAFDAVTGKEVFAYVPSMLMYRLKYLSSLPYEHLYYVDGQINVGKVKIGGVDKTLLVGGLGAGGRGLYALDITVPVTNADSEDELAARNPPLLRWEITPTAIKYVASTSYADLGYTYGTPVIAEADTGSVVIVGNGYRGEGNGHAVLYVINPDTGALIRAIDTFTYCPTGVDCGSTGKPSGLSTPTAIDTDDNGKVDRVYAGDLNGHLWKFDITNGAASLLFQAGKSITGAPAVAAHPEGGYIVTFGAGRMLVSDVDEKDTSIHSVYGIWDGAPSGNTTLLEQTLVEKSYTYGGVTTRVRVASMNPPNWQAGGHRGWRTSLPAGERVIADLGFIENGRFYFTATNPTVTHGENWLMELDYLTGGGGGAPFWDLNGDGLVNGQDSVAVTDQEKANTITGTPIGKMVAAGLLSQPVLARMASKKDTTLFNWNPNVDFEQPDATVDSGGPGISNGHFDFDIYYGGSSFAKAKHVHEYDDKYDVTGVNMLNASDPDFNLDNAIPDSTAFKILMTNQGLNRAVKFKFGSDAHIYNSPVAEDAFIDADGYISVQYYLTTASPLNADGTLNLGQLKTYTAANIGNLLMNMPKDAFAAKDWWSDGYTSVGLIPTRTGCVNGMSARNYNPTPGKNGEINNGAITVQLIKADTPASAVELNVAGDPKRGWRVKASNFTNYLLAQYTLFWHYGDCYDDSTWTPTPPPITPRPSHGGPARAAGSADPTTNASGGSAPATSTTTEYTKDALKNLLASTSTTKLSSTGKTTKVETTTRNADGTVTTTTTTYAYSADGETVTSTLTTTTTLDPRGVVIRGLNELRGNPQIGRVSWREFFRE